MRNEGPRSARLDHYEFRIPHFAFFKAAPWPIIITLFFCTLFLHSRNNRYPYYYEKDAGSKVAQVLSGERNFRHPMLMLNATDLVMRLSGVPRTPQAAVIAGRWCMAAFTAIAVAAFALIGFRFYGNAGALCVGVLVATHSLVFELSHIFKEDPALLLGLALSFHAMQVFWDSRSRSSAAWLGVVCGIAVSGKYVGIAALIMALLLLFIARGADSKKGMLWLPVVLGFVLTFCLLNYQILMQVPNFLSGFQTEVAHLTRESPRSEVPHIKQVVKTFQSFLPNILVVFVVVQIVSQSLFHRRQPVLWLMVAYPLIFTGILLFTPILSTRHFLPIFALACVLGGLGICAICFYFARGLGFQRTWLPLALSTALLALVYLSANHRLLRGHLQAYAQPTREQMFHWVSHQLPPDAIIAADETVFLLDPAGQPRQDAPVSQTVYVRKQLLDFGSLDELRRLGVTHVLAHSLSSELLFREQPKMRPGEPLEIDRHARDESEFYAKLASFAEMEHAIPSRQTAFVVPGLKLYRLPWEKLERHPGIKLGP